MNRRNFLTALSALPFMGWLKPAPINPVRITFHDPVALVRIIEGNYTPVARWAAHPHFADGVCNYDPPESTIEIKEGDAVYWDGSGYVARRKHGNLRP